MKTVNAQTARDMLLVLIELLRGKKKKILFNACVASSFRNCITLHKYKKKTSLILEMNGDSFLNVSYIPHSLPLCLGCLSISKKEK